MGERTRPSRYSNYTHTHIRTPPIPHTCTPSPRTLPGATLAQDRGRMEAQVEALLQEVKGLRQQTEKDRDNLRIKEKVIFERMLKVPRTLPWVLVVSIPF